MALLPYPFVFLLRILPIPLQLPSFSSSVSSLNLTRPFPVVRNRKLSHVKLSLSVQPSDRARVTSTISLESPTVHRPHPLAFPIPIPNSTSDSNATSSAHWSLQYFPSLSLHHQPDEPSTEHHCHDNHGGICNTRLRLRSRRVRSQRGCPCVLSRRRSGSSCI